MPTDLQSLLTDIHAAPHLGVLSFAGAGAQALAWLHSVGGSSRTVLEATDHYAASSLIQAVGFEPEQFTSERVAAALAARAYARARALAPGAPVFGLGCTASIATDRPKRGEHRAFIAVRDTFGTTFYTPALTKGKRTRQGEEEVVSRLIIRAVAEVCGLQNPGNEEGARVYLEPEPDLQALLSGEAAWVAVQPDGSLQTGQEGVSPHTALLSGSFNPLHGGHRELVQTAAQHLGREVHFELPLINADKAPIDLPEARRRAAQFAAYAPLVLTRTPLFGQKADLFPGSVFIVGADTAARLTAPRFYGGEVEMASALEHLQTSGCRFLVAGRRSQDEREARFLTLQDIDIPSTYRDLFEALPKEVFRRDISSSALRNDRNAT